MRFLREPVNLFLRKRLITLTRFLSKKDEPSAASPLPKKITTSHFPFFGQIADHSFHPAYCRVAGTWFTRFLVSRAGFLSLFHADEK